MRVLAVIPAYNEQDCLARTVTELTETCPEVDYLIVNDGSRDATQDIIEAKGLHAITLPVNTGLASGFKAGMKYAWRRGYDAVVQFDADGQHVPTYIPEMADALEEQEADIVIASRCLDGSHLPGPRGVGSRLISLLIRLTAGTVITDPTSGMRMYGRDMIELFAHGYDIAPEPDLLAYAASRGRRIVEIPTTMRERQGGASYLGLGNVVRYMGRTCLSILMFRFLR